jgi:glutamyl-tRNA synthetase
MNREVKVRFAPSPTGPLHIGGVRTALYNYLLAKKLGGKMILRIEDTDQGRFVPGAEAYIAEALAWCGIHIDEGPMQGGPHAPYRQSERKPMYKEFAQRLLDAGHAYYAFDTPEELDAMRERLKAARVQNPQYNSITRESMKNSLTLPEDEVKELIGNGTPYVIRLKVPRKEEVRLKDLIRGWVMVHSATLDDKVLMKSDGMPTYHLANVVDDHLMEITHVIRGEEWLPSAPLHVLLYRFLGWEDTMPQFAHLPLLLKPDGNGKLSKRDGDQLGFPVFPLEWQDPFTGERSSGFREKGFLPEAVVNFLAFLGWNPGTEQEIFSMEGLIEAFSIERIGKSGTKFDFQKAKWFNHYYLNQLNDAMLWAFLKPDAEAHQCIVDDAKGMRIASLLKERATFPGDLWKEGHFLFKRPETYDATVASNRWNTDAVKVIKAFADKVETLMPFEAGEIKGAFENAAHETGIKSGKVLQALRLAVTGVGAGPDLMAIMELLGKEETKSRLNKALEDLVVSA